MRSERAFSGTFVAWETSLPLNFLNAKCYPQGLGILRNYRWSSSLISLDHTRDEQQKRTNIDKRNFP